MAAGTGKGGPWIGKGFKSKALLAVGDKLLLGAALPGTGLLVQCSWHEDQMDFERSKHAHLMALANAQMEVAAAQAEAAKVQADVARAEQGRGARGAAASLMPGIMDPTADAETGAHLLGGHCRACRRSNRIQRPS